jgi:hypothetical protein
MQVKVFLDDALGHRDSCGLRNSSSFYRGMSPFNENPFAVMTLIAAPAIVTNAASVLTLGTGNRLARVVDRSRGLAKILHDLDLYSHDYEVRKRQLEWQPASKTHEA